MEVKDQSAPEIIRFFASLQELKQLITQTLAERTPCLNREIYLDNKDLCKLLHISQRTLQEYRVMGILGYIQISGKILYKESDVIRMLEDHYVRQRNRY